MLQAIFGAERACLLELHMPSLAVNVLIFYEFYLQGGRRTAAHFILKFLLPI
jgi:hypothetical protein